MPLESGGHRGMLSEERTYLQDDSHNNVLKTDTKQVQLDTNQPQTDTNQPQAAIQNHDLILGAERIQEDINLEPVQTSQAYNSEEHGNAYQNQEQSYNEQRHQYTERAFSSSGYETFTQQIPKAGEYANIRGSIGQTRPKIQADSLQAHIHIKETLSNAGRNFTHMWTESPAPPPIPSANPDSELELSTRSQGLMMLNSLNISLLETDREKNIEKRELLEKKLPTVSVTKFSLKENSTKENSTVHRILDEREYRKQRLNEIKKYERREQVTSKIKQTGRLLFENQNIAEDEDTAAVKRSLKKYANKAKRGIRKDVRILTDKSYVYKRLKFADKRDRLIGKEGKRLKHEQGRILAANRRMAELDVMAGKKTGISEAARRAENRKIQQRKRQRKRIAEQQDRISRNAFRSRKRHQRHMKRASRKERRAVRRRNRAVLAAAASMSGIILLVALFIILFLMAFFSMFAHIATQTVTQNDYIVLTDVTEYLRDREAQLKELLEGEGRQDFEKNLDKECMTQNGEHVHEFIYNLPEFGFDDITLMAYLSAKFFEFDLQMVQSDLDEVFELMYETNIEIKKEERIFYNNDGSSYMQEVMVCYITVQKTELEDVAEARLDSEALELYKSYKYSGGGQQTYGPVMDGIDWSGKISSAYGWRIHPITGKKTFHDGVDIAVPTGTKLYSAVSGKVTQAYYSQSAGNTVTVKTESGWEVTYMHMDSISVSRGQTVTKGHFVGCSGNTGNSTGPHLHLRVHDSNGNEINPMFIIPHNGKIYDEKEVQ